MSANLRVSAWSTADEDAEAPCRHCDNCTRPPETVDERDVTVDAWRVLRVAEYVRRQKGRVTLNQLAELARGTGKGEFTTHGSKSGSSKAMVDLTQVCDGSVGLSREVSTRNLCSRKLRLLPCCLLELLRFGARDTDTFCLQQTEALTMRLYLDGYLEENIQQNAYAVNIYLHAHDVARDLTRYSSEAVAGGKGPRVVCTFLNKPKRANGKQAKDAAISDSASEDAPVQKQTSRKRKAPAPKPTSKKGKRAVVNGGDDDAEDEDFTHELQAQDAMDDSDDDEIENNPQGWEATLRPGVKRARTMQHNVRAKPGSSRKQAIVIPDSD